MLTGHERAFGDDIFSRQTLNGAVSETLVGKVSLKIEEGNDSTPFCDVAVIDLIDKGMVLSNHVTTSSNYCLHLNPIAEDLDFEQVQDVQLFVNGDVKKQRVKFTKGNFCVESLIHLNGCVQIESKTGQPIQKAGESGILITTTVDDDKPHIVNGLAVLTGILDDKYSIGQPLKRTIDRIKSLDIFKDMRIAGVRNYCGRQEEYE